MSILLRFETIAKFCPYTGCFNATDYVAGALVHCWTNQQMNEKKHYTDPINIFSHKWKQFFPSIVISFDYNENCTALSSHNSPSQVENIILSYLQCFKVITISFESDEVDHSFILFKCDNLCYIADAYGSQQTQRLLTIRVFNPTDFGAFLLNPQMSEWNRMFLCQEALTKKIKHIDLFCSYLESFENPNLIDFQLIQD